MTAKVTKMKTHFTLKDLKPKPYKLMLDVPGHPDVEMWMSIVGTDSLDYTKAASALYKERGSKTDKDMDVEDALAESAKLTASLVKDWGPVENFGEEFSYEAVVNLLSDFDYKWVRDQIDGAAKKRDNFFIS